MGVRRFSQVCAVAWVCAVQVAWAACPTRTYSYVSGQVISPTQVTTNEDNLYTYACAVDTFADGSIVNADLADNTIATGKILDGTIGVADIATDGVGSAEIAADAVGTSEIATDGVGAAEIAADAVGASEIAADSVALTTDTTGNYVASVVDGSGIDVTGTAAEGWTATVNLVYTDTLAADPTMNAEEARFSTDGTGGGLLFEGVTADTIEGLLVWSPTTSDRTLTLPDATDTLMGRATIDTVTGKTFAAADNVIAADTAVALAANGANCTTGNYPLGVDAAGAVESCTAVSAVTATTNGTFTRDVSLTTSLAITGAGFQPTDCIFLMTNDTPGAQAAIGLTDDASGERAMYQNDAGTANNWGTNASIGQFLSSAGNLNNAALSTYDSDGYTLTFTLTGSPTGTASWVWRCRR